MAKEQKERDIYKCNRHFFLHFEGKKEWKGYHKGGLDNSGKPASAFNAFKR